MKNYAVRKKIFFLLSFIFISCQSNPHLFQTKLDNSGTILIYFDKYYYQVNNGGIPERIEVPAGVFETDERYILLEKQYFAAKDSAIARAKRILLIQK